MFFVTAVSDHRQPEMALSRPRPVFAHRRTVRLVVDNDMKIDSLEIARSLPDFGDRIKGIVPQFGGRCFDITLVDAAAAASLAQTGFDYGSERKPLRLLGTKCVHVSIFVSVEFPDEDLLKILSSYGELKSPDLRRLYYPEEGFRHIQNGVRVAEFLKIHRDIPKRLVVAGIEMGFKYSGQPTTCYRCQSTEHVVKHCPKNRRAHAPPPPPPAPPTEPTPEPSHTPTPDGEQPAPTATSAQSEESEELFSTPSYAQAAASPMDDSAMDTSTPRRRKRDAPTPGSSDEELSVPSKHLALTQDPSPAISQSESTPATPPTENSSIPSADNVSTPPTQENSTSGLKAFLDALEHAGSNRSLLMASAPGPFYYKCRAHYLQHRHGNYTKENGRKQKTSQVTQEIWLHLKNTIRQDVFASLLEFHQEAQKAYNIFLH